jgi:hypothetical protein
VDRSPLENFVSRVRGLTKTQALDAAAAEALDAFDAASIPCMLLKGVALSHILYSGERQRGYNDVDLLVAPGHLADAHGVLTELGYTNTTAARGVEDIAGAVHAETWVRRNQQIGPLMIDLHARLPGVRASPEAAWAVLAGHRSSIEVCGREAPVLAREGLALHAAIHAAQHGPDDPKPLADLAYALERWPRHVWQDAAGLAAELDAVGVLTAGLRLLPAGERMAQELDLPPAAAIEWEIHNRAERPRGTFHLQALIEAHGVRERLGVVRRILFPKREWILYEDPRAAKGGARLAVARLRHILRTPLWAVRALLYRRRARRSVR